MNLYKRGVEVDVYCPICGNDYETTTHIFLDCELAMDYWRKSPFRLSTCKRKEKDFGAWCHGFINMIDADQSGLFVTLIWGMWFIRNSWFLKVRRRKLG